MSDTFLSLCQTLRRECGISGAGPDSVTGRVGIEEKIVNWIADADVAVQSLWDDWDFLWKHFTDETIAGSSVITAPADLGSWDTDSFYLNYSLAGYRKLNTMEYREWRDLRRNGVKANAMPEIVVVRPDKNLILEAPPDAEYDLTADYWQAPQRMTANTSVSPIPTHLQRIIIAQAKIYYAEHEDAPEVMQAALLEYGRLKGRLEAGYLPGHHGRYSGHNDMLVRVL